MAYGMADDARAALSQYDPGLKLAREVTTRVVPQSTTSHCCLILYKDAASLQSQIDAVSKDYVCWIGSMVLFFPSSAHHEAEVTLYPKRPKRRTMARYLCW